MIPICCIAYNRKDSLERLLCSLDNAYYGEPVTLIISIDKSNTNEVETFADSYYWRHGEKRVIKHDTNLGLRKHVLSCGNLLNDYEALVVLEDDITVAPSFYLYTKQCVDKFSSDDSCAGVSLYNFPKNYHNRLPFMPLKSDGDVYMMNCAQSWGQVWMKKQWFEFREWYDNHCEEFEENPNLPKTICHWPKSSWLKYHTRFCIEKEKYFIYPYTSLSTNNGDVGTHANKETANYQTQMQYGIKNKYHLQPSILYDGFFENTLLYESLGLNESELCIDLYGEKGNRENRRYWLTRNHENYRIIDSYALDLRPWELNVIEKRRGRQIFLYDTSIIESNYFEEDDTTADYFFQIPFIFLKIIVKEKIIRFFSRLIKKK